MRITAEPISHAAFAPFGDLVVHRGDKMRRYLDHASDHVAPADAMRFWVSRYDAPKQAPLAYPKLERHPFSAQTFIPLRVKRYVVIAAPTRGDGGPDLAGLRAFVVGAGTGVSYRRATWHGPMTILDDPAELAVMMWSTGDVTRDDEWFDLGEPLTVDIDD